MSLLNKSILKLISYITISFYTNIHAQKIKGRIIDEASKDGIPFANIGIKNKGVGTTSDELGNFELKVPDSLIMHKLSIAQIGYDARDVSIIAGKQNYSIILKPRVYALNEVTVMPKVKRRKKVGNETYTQNLSGGFVSNKLGAEIAVKIKTNNNCHVLRKIGFNLIKNNYDSTLFRFNVYKADKSGKPGENILKQVIIINAVKNNGLTEMDLTAYNIEVCGEYFISLEWIKDYGDSKGLLFSTKLFAKGTYYRTTSHDKWDMIKPAGIGLFAEVEY